MFCPLNHGEQNLNCKNPNRRLLYRAGLVCTVVTACFAKATFAESEVVPQPTIQLEDGSVLASPVTVGNGSLNPHIGAMGDGRFGTRRSGGRTHTGIDQTAPEGTEIRSPVSGRVVSRGTQTDEHGNVTGSGNYLNIQDDTGRIWKYWHLQSERLQPGTRVNAGDVIANVGRSGNTPSTAASHLHLQVTKPFSNEVQSIDSRPDPRIPKEAAYENYLRSLPTTSPKTVVPSTPSANPTNRNESSSPSNRNRGQEITESNSASAKKWTAQVEGGNHNAALGDGTWKTLGQFNTYDEARQAIKKWDDAHPGSLRLTREIEGPASSSSSNGVSKSNLASNSASPSAPSPVRGIEVDKNARSAIGRTSSNKIGTNVQRQRVARTNSLAGPRGTAKINRPANSRSTNLNSRARNSTTAARPSNSQKRSSMRGRNPATVQNSRQNTSRTGSFKRATTLRAAPRNPVAARGAVAPIRPQRAVRPTQVRRPTSHATVHRAAAVKQVRRR